MKNYVSVMLVVTSLSISSVCCADASKANQELVDVSVNFNGKVYKSKIPKGFDLVKHSEYAPGFDKCMQKVTVRYDSVACYDDALKFQLSKLKENFIKAKKACKSPECTSELLALQKSWIDKREKTVSFLKRYIAIYGYTSEVPMEYELEELQMHNKVIKSIQEFLESENQ